MCSGQYARQVVYVLAVIWMTLLISLSANYAVASPMPDREPTPTFPSPVEQSTNSEAKRKQDLEIKKLEQDTGNAATIRVWLPAGSAIIALAAVTFGAYQYFRDRRGERDIRIQEQFSSNLETVAGYVREENRTTARLLAALTTLKAVVELSNNKDDYCTQVTEVIVAEVRDDVDFEDEAQARFDLLCLKHWPDYGSWLKKNPTEQEFFMYRYSQAVRVFAERHREYFAGVKVDGNTLLASSYIEERDFLHLSQLVNGYKAHLALSATANRSARITEFGAALGNASLAEDLLVRRI